MSPIRIKKENRLRKTKEFCLVYSKGDSWVNELLVLKAMPNGIQGVTRFGFSVGKRAGNAVVRNTIKRRTREAVRHIPIVDGWDLVFIAKSRANKAKYNQLLSSVHNLLEKASLLNMGTTSQE